MNSTTLKTISEVLGISISTVSRALKNHPDISEKTKRKVTELADTLDYEPNVNAIQLRTSKSNILAVMVPYIADFFYHFFIASIEEECHQHNFTLMILQSGDDAATEAANIRLCRQNRISGLFASISTRTSNMENFQKLAELNIPVVFFDKVPENSNYNKVCVADEAAATLAADVILDKEKKQVLALFGDDSLLITKKRLSAFKKCLEGKVQLDIAYADSTEEADEITLKRLAGKPDVVFCMSDEILSGAMKAIQRAGLKIPDDIGVIAISNGFIPKLYYPEITYIETSGHKLGKLAFSAMTACMKGSSFVQELTSESILVKGGSL